MPVLFIRRAAEYFKKHLVCQSCFDNLTTSVENQDTVKEPQPARPKVLRKDTLLRLVEVIEKNPTATQSDLSALLGVSQSRISQLQRTF